MHLNAKSSESNKDKKTFCLIMSEKKRERRDGAEGDFNSNQ